MVDFYIYAKDFSASTEKIEYYHNNGLKTFEEFKRDVKKIRTEVLTAGKPPIQSKIIYLHWGDKCYEVDEDTTVQTYIEQQCGIMSTDAATIIKWIKQNYEICSEANRIKLLYIITDGMINSGIEKCFELNEDMQYETVVFHAFNKCLEEIDLSVASSFFKSKCMVYRNYELLDDINISEEFDYDKITIANFMADREILKSYIRLKFIREFKPNALALKEIDKLKKLRNRLFEELSSKKDKGKVNLETKDKEVFLQEFVRTDWYENLELNDNILVEIEKSISTLINYIVSDKKSYSFDALKFETNYRDSVEEERIVDVNFTAEQQIEFPDIILDEDQGIPVVILMQFNLLDKLIFHGTNKSHQVSSASFSKFKSAMQCPLFLINDPDISESIGHFYTLNVYKQLLEKTNKTEPRTRRPFHGGLVLTDTDLFDKYNDYILSATYFDSKKVNFNIGLFYFVLWKNCESKEWMDKNVATQFKNYVMRRISMTVCRIGLSSLPLDPQAKVSLPTALWYCIELSSRIFKNHPQHFMQERLRMFYGVSQSMVEILEYFKYDVDWTFFAKRRDLISYVMALKKIPKYVDKVYYLLENIFKKENGFLISEIEKPYNLIILNYLKLDHKSLLHDDVINEKVDLIDYVYMMHYVGKSKICKDTIRICEKTFRPFFTIEKNKSFYTELFEATMEIVINNYNDEIYITSKPLNSLEFDRILSLYNQFIRCVKDSEKYPTLPEYIEYIIKKKKFKGDLVTIFPPNVYLSAQNVYLQYQNIVTKVDFREFLRVTNTSVNRAERIKAENVIKFDDDREIGKFISSEELKVNLKKT